eukprot:g8213.t1
MPLLFFTNVHSFSPPPRPDANTLPPPPGRSSPQLLAAAGALGERRKAAAGDAATTEGSSGTPTPAGLCRAALAQQEDRFRRRLDAALSARLHAYSVSARDELRTREAQLQTRAAEAAAVSEARVQ